MTAAPPLLAVMNEHEEVRDFFAAFLDAEGYQAATHAPPSTTQQVELAEAWLAAQRPAAVLYDISYPYDYHLKIFEALQHSPAAAGLPFVITTTSPELTAPACDGEALPVLRLPFDVDELLMAVRDTLARLRAQSDATSRALRQSHTTIARAADLLRETRRQTDGGDESNLPLP